MWARDEATLECVMFSVIRASSLEQVTFSYELATREIGYNGGANNPKILYATDPTGAFIGELKEDEERSTRKGRRISVVIVTKYGDGYAYVSFYAVEKAYRGRGYGLQTFKAGMASVGKTDVTSTD